MTRLGQLSALAKEQASQEHLSQWTSTDQL